jgi:hypothetical protein
MSALNHIVELITQIFNKFKMTKHYIKTIFIFFD